jgi:two-component system CheB/CheR fusion protein
MTEGRERVGRESRLTTPTRSLAVNEAGIMDISQLGQPLRVLVVDDDRDTADSYRLLLSLWGHRPLVAYDAQAALEAAGRQRPDLVLLDLAMPGVDGWELARRLRAEPALEGLVLLAVSGYGQPADRERSHAAGIDEHLLKPVDPHLLYRLLEQCQVRHQQPLALG